MRTHRNCSARRGDVIDVRSGVSGRSYGDPVIVTDQRTPADRPCCAEGGHECRKATPSEVAAARAADRVIVVYD
jgi:hypothetical protein